jgi:hypothetical protein
MSTAPDGRKIFVWHGNNIDELTDVIASTIEIYNHNDGLVTLDQGKLAPVNMTDFKQLIDKHICGVRVVAHGNGGYKKEYFSYPFNPTPPPGPRTAAMGLQRWEDSKEPDNKVLSEIYRQKLLKLVPKVE